MNKMKQIITGFTFALFTGLATMSGNVLALTPDGETPANEDVCDGLQGASPGLYGLCVAYCEAQDLDTIDKKPPSLKILENYNKKKQSGDPVMPCTSENFGCFTQAELDSISTTNSCMRFVDGNGEVIQYGIQDKGNSHFVKVDRRPTEVCVYVDLITANIVRNHYFEDNVTQAAAAFAAVSEKCPN